MPPTPSIRHLVAAIAAAACAAIMLTETPATAQSDDYTPVTAERLRNPEPHNWLMYRRTYNGWGYSPLDQINRDNVGRLTPVWTFSTGVLEGHEAPPVCGGAVRLRRRRAADADRSRPLPWCRADPRAPRRCHLGLRPGRVIGWRVLAQPGERQLQC